MNLRQIESFLDVIEEGTFSAGAKRLKVSQPTVSKLIDALERGLVTSYSAAWARASCRPTRAWRSIEMTWVKRGFDLLND